MIKKPGILIPQMPHCVHQLDCPVVIEAVNAQRDKDYKEMLEQLKTSLEFANKVANHFNECRDSRIFFIIQQAFGDIDWEEAQDILNTVIEQTTALQGLEEG